MMKACRFCNGTGKKLHAIPFSGGHFIKVKCKKCHGKGLK